MVVDAPASVGKGQELVISGTLVDIGGVPAGGQTLEFEVWEPTAWGNKPNTVRCNPSGWQRYRCDIGTAETDDFGNFIFNLLILSRKFIIIYFFHFFLFFFFLSYSLLFSINIKASSIVSSVGSFSSGIVAFNDLYLI